MSDIAIIGTQKYGNLEWFLARSFEELGHSTSIINNDEFIFTYAHKRFHEYFRMLVARQPTIRNLFITKNQNIIANIKKRIIQEKPRIVLVAKGHFLPPEVVEWMRREVKCKVVLNAVDDPAFFDSLSKDIAQAYDHVFTGAENCITQYNEIGIKNISYLALGCYPPVHKQTNFDWDKKPYDITFVGTYYPERGRVINELKNYNLHLWGPLWNMFWIDKKVKTHLHKTDWLSAENIVDIYNLSKIVINIHAKPQVRSRFKANMKVFEISASYSFQLCDYIDGLEDLYDIGHEIEVYHDMKELKEKVDYYLANSEARRKIAEAAHKRSYHEHKYTDRATEILKQISNL